MKPEELDKIGRTLGRWLAPYVAEHMTATPATPTREPATTRSEWDDATCRIFVRELGDSVVDRAQKFFAALEEHGELTSIEVKELLGLPNQRAIGANLTVSLRKRVRSLGLASEPWEIDMTPDGERTIWRNRDGIALRMFRAATAEKVRRVRSKSTTA